MTSRIRVDGLTVSSGVRLPGARRAREGPTDWKVRVVRGAPDEEWPGGLHVTGGCRDRARVWAQFARGGTSRAVLVRNWFRLVAESVHGVAELRHARPASEDALVLRRALPYLSALKGRLVLHAASVVLPAGAVVLCADARTGKSTLALALDAAGFPVLGDDHVSLETTRGSTFLAHASLPWVEVAARSVRTFRPDVRDPDQEGSVALRILRPREGVPVVGLVLLRRGAGLYRRKMQGARLLPRLIRRFAFVGDPSDRQETAGRFDAALRLVTTVPCATLTVPTGLPRLRKSLAAVPLLLGAR